jgi:hypothetical protein
MLGLLKSLGIRKNITQYSLNLSSGPIQRFSFKFFHATESDIPWTKDFDAACGCRGDDHPEVRRLARRRGGVITATRPPVVSADGVIVSSAPNGQKVSPSPQLAVPALQKQRRRSNLGLANGLPLGWFASLLVTDPVTQGRVYAVGSFSTTGLYRSDNGGNNWIAIGPGLPDGAVSALAVDPGNPAMVYAAPSAGGLYRSTDAGAHFTSCPSCEFQL